jgi:hypothetical protein
MASRMSKEFADGIFIILSILRTSEGLKSMLFITPRVRKEAVFRSHVAAALEIETTKEQDEILEDTRLTRLAITIDDKDEEITIDDLLPVDDLLSPSTSPATIGNRSKRARARRHYRLSSACWIEPY